MRFDIMTDIFNKAAQLYDGDQKRAAALMCAPHEDFNGYSPLQWCKPYDGAVAVDAWLDRKLAEKTL